MVRGVRLGQRGESAGTGRPVEPSTLHDHAAERGAVSAEELGRRFDDDVGAVFERPEQVRRGEGVVDDHRQPVAVSDRRNRLEVGQVGIGVAESLEVDEPGAIGDRRLQGGVVGDVDERGGDPVARQRVAQQVVGAAVDGAGGDDVVAGLGDVAQRVFDGGRARGDGERRGAAFERGDALFEHLLRRVGQPPVDVARIGEREPGRGLVKVAEHVAGRGVDRHGAGVGGGVGLFLAGVQLQGFEVVLCGGHGRSWFVGVGCWVGGAMHGHRGVGGDCRPRGGGAARFAAIDVGYGRLSFAVIGGLTRCRTPADPLRFGATRRDSLGSASTFRT